MDDNNENQDDREMNEDEAVQDQKVINEEYKIWKKNSPMLYDMFLGRALEWPTLTVQWFPDKQAAPDKDFSLQRLLLGTHTAGGKPNYLQIANVQLPNVRKPDISDYDENRGEIGGYNGTSAGVDFKIVQKINHPCEVNKARYMPQNPNLIATMCTDGKVLVFDRTKHASVPDPSGKVDAQSELKGHTQEGYGLNWNPHSEGALATGSEDTTVRVWNITDIKSNQKTIHPKHTYTHHTATVNDVQHHPVHRHWIGTVSDDMTFKLIDTRTSATNKAVLEAVGHKDAVNSLAFHPEIESMLATGSADKTIGIWDMRNLKHREAILENHRETIQQVEWNPHDTTILASGSYDRRVNIWDITKVGSEQTPEDAEDGPPELLFMHGGHTSHVSEFSWNPSDPWTLCSAAEDNLIQIWRPAKAIVDTAPHNVTRSEISH